MFEINELLLLLFLLPILQIKWSNCRKCKYNVSQSYNKMITDTFYPIFTLTITVLACFIQKKQKQKKNWGLHPHQGISLDPLRGLQLPQIPSCNCFWLCQKPVHPYFFCIIPCEHDIMFHALLLFVCLFV